jgi:hypothetical protein
LADWFIWTIGFLKDFLNISIIIIIIIIVVIIVVVVVFTTDINFGIAYKHTSLLEVFFGKPKLKHTIIKSKEGKMLLENEERADRWQHYIEELCNDSDVLEELEREKEITTEELGATVKKAEFEKALNELK